MAPVSRTLAQAVGELEALYVETLWPRVADHLTGRRVRLEWRPPAFRGARGFAFRDGDTPVIHVKPGLSDGQKLATFLHECGHIRFDYDVMTHSPLMMGDPGSVVWTRNKAQHDKTYGAGARENRAAQRAEKWAEYARAKAKGPTVRHYLTALLGWKG